MDRSGDASAALAPDPRSPSAQGNAANELLARGRPAEALLAYRRALELAGPQGPLAATLNGNLGACLEALEDPRGALDAWRRAADLGPGEVRHHLGRARAAQAAWEVAEAEEAARAALALDPTCVQGELALAAAAESRGDRPALARHARRALDLRPDHTAPYYPLARGGLVEAEELEARLGDLPEGDDRQVLLRFALAHALDRRGDHEQAFAQLTRANAGVGVGARFEVGPFQAELEAIEAFFDPRWLATHRSQGKSALEPVFLVGMARSGSSLVEQILAAHPAVHGVGERDALDRAARSLGPWPGALADLDRPRAQGAAEHYRRALGPLPTGTRRVTDKTLSNFGRLPLIAALFPRTRVIHCRRDPRDACLSAYFLHFAEGVCPWTYDLNHLAQVWRAYQSHMERWRAVSPVPFLELDYEELVADPRGVTARLLDFVGLGWDEACLDFHRSGRAVSSSSAGQVHQPMHQRSVGRWRAYARWIEPLLGLHPGAQNPTESSKDR